MCWARTGWHSKATETGRKGTAAPARFAEPPAREVPTPETRQHRPEEPVPAA